MRQMLDCVTHQLLRLVSDSHYSGALIRGLRKLLQDGANFHSAAGPQLLHVNIVRKGEHDRGQGSYFQTFSGGSQGRFPLATRILIAATSSNLLLSCKSLLFYLKPQSNFKDGYKIVQVFCFLGYNKPGILFRRC